MTPHKITRADIILAAALALLGGYLVGFSRPSAPGVEIVISSASGAPFAVSLSENQVVRVAGSEGETVIEIADGVARFMASPCPHKLCIGRGAISKRGEWIACVPNGVFARVVGKAGEVGEGRYDGITP